MTTEMRKAIAHYDNVTLARGQFDKLTRLFEAISNLAGREDFADPKSLSRNLTVVEGLADIGVDLASEYYQIHAEFAEAVKPYLPEPDLSRVS